MTVLNEGHAWGAASPALLGCALLTVILFALFIRAERRAKSPLVDLTLFGRRAFAAGNVASVMSFAALFGTFFLMPFVLIRAYQETALVAGLRLSIIPVLLGAVAPLGGMLYDKVGSRIVTTTGMLICVTALALLYAVLDGKPENLPWVMLAMAAFGIGQGLF